jgi:hypothetical protein
VGVFGVAALAAALTLVVVGALQAFGVTTLDADDMLAALFILLGAVAAAGAFAGSGPSWPRRG